ncbi:MAG: hypothetical protein WC805_01275 [Patescibacteria group bacterium]|jgi:hypothetical protein
MNIWFYTLSSISQVMAAIVALFGVFSVYKLGIIDKEINDYRNRAVELIMATGVTNQSDAQLQYLKSNKQILKEFEQALEKASQEGKVSLSFGRDHVNQNTYNLFDTWVQLRDLVLSRLVNSIKLTLLPLVFSIMLLAIPLELIQNPLNILWVIASLAVIGVLYIGVSIWEISR